MPISSLIPQNLENDPSVIYTLDRELRITYCNLAWDRFAVANGGAGLERRHQVGRPVMEAIPRSLRQLFLDGYTRVLALQDPWVHSYECSSPNVYRSFQMVVYPNTETGGLIVVNSLAVERPHDVRRERHAAGDHQYQDHNGFVTMCCACRRTSRVNQRAVWDWVPEFVERPPDPVTHGICAVCVNLIYPDLAGL